MPMPPLPISFSFPPPHHHTQVYTTATRMDSLVDPAIPLSSPHLQLQLQLQLEPNHHRHHYSPSSSSSPKLYHHPLPAAPSHLPHVSPSSLTSSVPRNHNTSRKHLLFNQDTSPLSFKLQHDLQPLDAHTFSAQSLSKFNTPDSATKHRDNGFRHTPTSNHLLQTGEFKSHLHPGSSMKDPIGNSQFESPPQSATHFCPASPYSFYSAAPYIDPKPSFSNTDISECATTVEDGYGSAEVHNSYHFVDTHNLSAYRVSSSSNVSDDSSTSSLSGMMYKPHKANDKRWEAIQVVRSHYGSLELKHFRVLRMLGSGDVGKVYLSELAGTGICFAIKAMDKADLGGRKKLARSQTEKEILQSLDHPFLPTLYAHFETERCSCLVMEYCPGGDLHVLRQRQPGKFFSEHAARFYVAEVLLALEYLHMLGIIYRDLKPENVLVREDGHIMLSDFDLSLRCVVSPTLVKSANLYLESKKSSGGYCVQPACMDPSCMKQPPDCIQSTCFSPQRNRKDKRMTRPRTETYQNDALNNLLPELLAEPTSARSMSFVGTHEYLAPEIVKGEGHGSAVDWWTFGIFLYELLFGRTPFKGAGNRGTLLNVVGQPLRFPDAPTVSFAARDLIRGLLVKEPQHRLAYRRGATEIKQHPFFQSVNWALIRCATPPEVPKPVVAAEEAQKDGVDAYGSADCTEMEFF